ncbi:MAG: hypothetical protein ACRCST_01560 [Turicibacter sp.]
MKLTISDYAEQNGFEKLTSSNHPKNGQIVQILGSSLSKDISIEKVEWRFDGQNHSYKWITHEFNRGIMTTSFDYWRPFKF